MTDKTDVNLDEMKTRLSPEQYNVCFLKGTEPPFSGKYTDNKQPGTYACVACGADLFDSAAKFNSGTGWPSFDRPSANDHVAAQEDLSHGMRRIEVMCKNCGAHLGHVFDDGPAPTGKRYCINSLSLDFKARSFA